MKSKLVTIALMLTALAAMKAFGTMPPRYYTHIPNLYLSPKGIKKLIDKVRYNHKVTDLRLRFAPIDKDCVDHIVNLILTTTTLKGLYLGSTEISDEDIIKIAEALEKNSTIEILSITNCKLTKKCIPALRKALTSKDNALKEIYHNFHAIGEPTPFLSDSEKLRNKQELDLALEKLADACITN